jgi:hypothetical protein
LARQQDVFLLTALGSSGQKDDERIPVMAEINPVAWPKVEAQRGDPRTFWLHHGRVSISEPDNRLIDTHSNAFIEILAPS